MNWITLYARGRALVLLAVLALFLLALAWSHEDPDAAVCSDRGGVVEVDEYPHQPAVHRCVVNGEIVRAWKRVNGKNVLILDWSVHR